MGSDRYYPEEGPAHEVALDSFWIDETPGPGWKAAVMTPARLT